MTNHGGTFIGRTTREHGISRQHHSVISTDAGGLVFTEEPIDLPSGTRVSFTLTSGASSETMATDVKPLNPPPAVDVQPAPEDAAPTKRVRAGR